MESEEEDSTFRDDLAFFFGGLFTLGLDLAMSDRKIFIKSPRLSLGQASKV